MNPRFHVTKRAIGFSLIKVNFLLSMPSQKGIISSSNFCILVYELLSGFYFIFIILINVYFIPMLFAVNFFGRFEGLKVKEINNGNHNLLARLI